MREKFYSSPWSDRYHYEVPVVLLDEADTVNDSQPSGNRSLNERHCCELLTILITVLESVDIKEHRITRVGICSS